MHHWIGIVQNSAIQGLFDNTLTAPNTGFTDGDIVSVSEQPHLIAPAHSARAKVIALFGRFDMNPAHPSESREEAAAWTEESGIDDDSLNDLRQLPFVTIDNLGSRDLDQALYIEANDSGFTVYYALADASYYVQPGSSLFQQALQRGATYYAPSIAAPMLPRSLSEDLVSLNPKLDRRALNFKISLDKEGNVTDTDITRAVIHSRAQLTYEGVQEYYDHDEQPAHLYQAQDFAASLDNLKQVGLLRMALARHRNVIEYNRYEPQLTVDGSNPNCFTIELRERNDTERYNEQISLLCNIEGAKLLEHYSKASAETQSVYRVHNPPMEKRLIDLRKQLAALAELHQLNEQWIWKEDQDLADFLSALPDASNTDRIRQAFERQILLTNNASVFSATAGPHHALGVDAYARFSSPMREVVGIFTHKELLEGMGLTSPRDIALDEALREEIITTANAAKSRQKQLDKELQLQVIDQFLQQDAQLPLDQRTKRDGTVMGMRGSRIYITLDGFALDLKIYAEDLEQRFNCQYNIEDTIAKPDNDSAPSFKIGDGVSAKVLEWDEKRRKFILDIQLLVVNNDPAT